MDKTDFTKQRLLLLAAEEGLKSRQGRIQCPARCTEDSRGANVSDSANGALWDCKHCGAAGSAIDLLVATRSVDAREAIRILRDMGAPAPLPPEPNKPPPIDVTSAWASFTDNDPAGIGYLRGRGLDEAAANGWVRFATGHSGQSWIDKKARAGYVVAMPLYDQQGALRSLQLRAVKAMPEGEANKLSLPGITTRGIAFGCVTEARTAETVHVAEGIADTLALRLAGAVVVGAPGSDQVANLDVFLGDPAGREFVLCRQHDTDPRAVAQADRAFSALAAKLEAGGGTVRELYPPAAHKDPADWLQAAGRERFARAIADPPTATDGSAALNVLRMPAPAARPLAKSFASLCQIFRTPALRTQIGVGEVEWNEMEHSPAIDRVLVQEHLVGALRERIETTFTVGAKRTPMKMGSSDILEALHTVAHERPYHPVRDYLRSLEWDGEERIPYVLDEILGADRTELGIMVLRRWFVSAVARALEPGCKVDTMLILQGDQGAQKSGFFRTLAGEEWFSDTPVDLANKDALLLIRSIWIYEWAELEAMQRARDSSAVKAFLSSPVDRFRQPYGRGIVTAPRHCVIVGTSNPDEILADPTGSRRFWIIAVGERIDLQKLREWREQLWAEAVALHARGERWWTDRDEDRALAAEQDRWRKRDPWEDVVLEYVHRQLATSGVTTGDVLEHALFKDRDTWTSADARRVANILTAAGWEQSRPTVSGKKLRIWVRKAVA